MKQQGDITASEYEDAVGQGLGLHPSRHKYSRIRQPYIFDLVKQELERPLRAEHGPRTAG